MYLAIGELVHPVHEENAAGLRRQGIDGPLVQSEQIRGFEIPLLRGGRGAFTFIAQRKEGRARRFLAPGAIDKQVLGDTTKETARIGELVPLLAARRARKDFLDKIGRFLGARLAAQEMKERIAVRTIGRLEILAGLWPLSALWGSVGRMHMAGRGR